MRYFLIDTDDGKSLSNVIVKANTIEEALRIARNENETLNEERQRKMTDYEKIKAVLKALPYEKLIDVHNEVFEVLGIKEQGYIYKADDETIDIVFKDWKPSEVIRYLDDD